MRMDVVRVGLFDLVILLRRLTSGRIRSNVLFVICRLVRRFVMRVIDGLWWFLNIRYVGVVKVLPYLLMLMILRRLMTSLGMALAMNRRARLFVALVVARVRMTRRCGLVAMRLLLLLMVRVMMNRAFGLRLIRLIWAYVSYLYGGAASVL